MLLHEHLFITIPLNSHIKPIPTQWLNFLWNDFGQFKPIIWWGRRGVWMRWCIIWVWKMYPGQCIEHFNCRVPYILSTHVSCSDFGAVLYTGDQFEHWDKVCDVGVKMFIFWLVEPVVCEMTWTNETCERERRRIDWHYRLLWNIVTYSLPSAVIPWPSFTYHYEEESRPIFALHFTF